MDHYAFASLAHVQILLLPVGPISRPIFERYAAEVRSFDNIRLSDIPADQKDDRARFMPKPMSMGSLHLNFLSHPPPSTHSQMALFRPSRLVSGVIGIATSSPTQTLASTLKQFESLVSDISPPSPVFSVAKSCFVFEEDEVNGTSNLGENISGLVVIPSMMGNKKLYIGTLLADLCSHILGDFGRIAGILETPLGNEYLNASLFPVFDINPTFSQTVDGNGVPDSAAKFPSHSSQPDLDILNSIGPSGESATYKRNSSAGPPAIQSMPAVNQRQSTLVIPLVKKRSSAVGAVSSHGRLFKVLGDLFLMAGRTEDAVLWYTEAVTLMKPSPENVWHASALEGIATAAVIDAWSAAQGLQVSISHSKDPWNDSYEKLTQAVALYKSASLSEISQHPSFVAYLLTVAALRQSSLLFCIWSAKGWGPLAFSAMLQPGTAWHLKTTLSDNSWSSLERLSVITGISRSQIANAVAQAHGPWLLHLGVRERLSALQTMASTYTCLGYQRKEAYVLREVLGCIMDLIVCGRDEGGEFREPAVETTGLGIQGVAMGIRNGDGTKGNVGVRRQESAEGNESLLKVLVYACKILGVDLTAVKVFDPKDNRTSGFSDSDDTAVSLALEEDELSNVTSNMHGWPELQIGIVREAMAIAEALPDYVAVAQIALSALKTLHSVLGPGDQYHLYQTSARALATARRRGLSKSLEYWAGRPVMSITLLPLHPARIPLEKSISSITTKQFGINSILIGATDPFLYNPRKSAVGQGKSLVVQREPLEFTLMLTNPFVFDLELQSLSLSTLGVPFNSAPLSRVVIQANSSHPVTITGTAMAPGVLVIRGCHVQAPGFLSREFLLPLSTEEEEDSAARRRSAIKCESNRSKYSGLEARSWIIAGKRLSTVTPPARRNLRFLEYKVVPEQPLLRIRWSSLTHGSLMLYDGERSSVRLTLENVSSLPIDFLRLSFEDNTIAPAQRALSDGDLSVFDTYETEYDLIHRQAFSWQSSQHNVDVKPGQKCVVTIDCLGKAGCVSGAVYISYSYIHRPNVDTTSPSAIFHTRQLTYPMSVTVYHMLECHDMDILPFDDLEQLPPQNDDDDERCNFRSLFQVENKADWCLFSIDVRNAYGVPFEVTFDRHQADTPPASVSSIVPPGSMSRFLIPVKKFALSEEKATEVIPTLSNRQFVVAKSRLTSEQEKIQCELFWYREELFKFIRGRWKETNGERSGELNFRHQRITFPMLEALRKQATRVELSLVQQDCGDASSILVTRKGGKYVTPLNEILYLRIRVTNLSPLSLVLTVNLTMDPAEHIIFQGVLSSISLGRLGSGECKVVDIPLSFLCYGSFIICGEARVWRKSGLDNRAGIGQLNAIVGEEERGHCDAPV